MIFPLRRCSIILLGFATVASCASIAHCAPLVVNGDFETGNIAGWTLSGNSGFAFASSSPSYVHTGTSGAALGAMGSLGFLSQDISTTPGDTYQVSYWFFSDGSTPNEFSASLGGTQLFDQQNIPAQIYTQYSFNVGATAALSTLQFGSRDDLGFLGLDDVSVTDLGPSPVPEPWSIANLATMGLVGLAMAGYFSRKKFSLGFSA